MPETPIDVSLHDLLHQREWLARLAHTLVHDPHHAEDAAQQTWLQALVARTPLRGGRAWLSAVLANVVRQRHRGDVRRARREQTVAAERAEFADAAAEANERFETQRTVAAAVQALAEPFRSTVLLHHFDGMSLAAIARSQNVPAGTVRWRLHRAHEQLRGALAARCGADWRRALLVLCAPARRSALLAPVLSLLLAAGVVTGAVVWATSGATDEPPAHRTAVAAAAGDQRKDQPPADRVAARGAADANTASAPTASTAPAIADQSVMVRARIVGSDGAPLPNASLRLAKAKLGRDAAPAALLAQVAPPVQAGADGRVALPLRAPGELLALAPELPNGGFVATLVLAANADGHAEEQVEVHVANGDDRDVGRFVVPAR